MRARAALIALALLAAAAGCAGIGDGGDEETFREAAEEICADYDAKIEAVAPPTDLVALADSSTEIADLLEEQQAELRELSVPGGLSSSFSEWLELNDEAIENAREISMAAEEQEEARIRELAQLAQRNARQADRLANDLEIRTCMIEERELTNR